jgi:hypothetical protein
MRTALALISILLLGAASAAAQDFPDGTFASSSEGCEKLSSKTPAELGEDLDFSVLTKTGVTAYQQRCDFLNVTARNATSWLASAFCEESGYIYPDLFAVAKKDDGSLSVTRMTDVAQQDGFEGGSDDSPALSDDMNPSEIDRDDDKGDSPPDDGDSADAEAAGGAFSTFVPCQTVKP